jgi:DNA-binding response OmpR family regulator/HPt (histidine-containing phosphotransfer) domain-containing protein
MSHEQLSSAAKTPHDGNPGEAAIHEARQRFVAKFSRQCDSIAALVEAVAQLGEKGPLPTLLRMLHNIAGHAGTIGFPRVSENAATLETLMAEIGPRGFDSRVALELVEALRDDFATALVSLPLHTEGTSAEHIDRSTILVVENDHHAREGITEYLIAAGYSAIGLPAAESLLEVVRGERPALILLDVGLPGMDGFAACRLLKTDPDLSAIPVIFLAASTHIDDRLTGLTLGAEEFLSKPVDVRELALRIQLLLARHNGANGSAVADDRRRGKSSYAAFAGPASEALEQSAAALALVRLPAAHRAEASAAIGDGLRRRDLIGRYDPSHLVVLMPEVAANDARAGLAEVIGELTTRGIEGVHAGVAASSSPRARTLDALLVEADEALAEARAFGEPAATKSNRPPSRTVQQGVTVVVADDDPEVTRIVDAQLRGAGYSTVIAFDGVDALAAVESHRPEMLVLDLMLPKMSGFDVLGALDQQGPDRPRVLVLSERVREEDVVRAFAAGADDYMTKPFHLGELLVRIDRLVQRVPHD